MMGLKQLPKIVIAHRGASGYLPEHTLPATAMAFAQGADYLEADIVLTQEGVPIVLHDLFLELTSNVAELFPKRARADGHFYALDFKIREIKQLNVHERISLEDFSRIYPARFPLNKSKFEIPTLSEWLELVVGLNQSTGEKRGIYPELKAPLFHEKAGYPLSKIVLELLEQYDYKNQSDNVYLQCFDPTYLKQCRQALKSKLPMIQLIAQNAWQEASVDFDTFLTEPGLQEIATYAEGIGLWYPQATEKLIEMAHHQNLLVHLYTLRADDLPQGFSTFEALLENAFFKLNADGVFTDFPDKAVHFLKKNF